MPSKLKKAIGAVKDMTSITLAKASCNIFSHLEIVVLKATTHDEIPIEDRYIDEVLLLISSYKACAAPFAQAIARRIGRTHSWTVALKSLMLVLRIFQHGDPHFPLEVLHAMKRGAKILKLSSFRDDSNSRPWDYTAYVRTFGLYLNERLNCFLTGKLEPCKPIRDMKLPMLLDRISYWQRLLDLVIATQPTGEAKTNPLVQISLYWVVRESFDLYRDISNGLTLLLDSFFHMRYQSCIDAFQACIKASKQFQELRAFYTLCKRIGVGRAFEYPRISQELLETLREFLKNKSSFSIGNRRLSEDKVSDMGLELSKPQTSLEDLFSMTPISIDQKQVQKQFQLADLINMKEEGTCMSDLIVFDDQPQQEELQQPAFSGVADDERKGWELVLAETARDMSCTQESCNIGGGLESSLNGLNNQASLQQHHSNHSNPFLQDTSGFTATSTTSTAIINTFLSFPTFQATPTFSARSFNEPTMALHMQNDPFPPCTPQKNEYQIFSRSTNHQCPFT